MLLIHGGCSSAESFEKYKKWIAGVVPEDCKLHETTHPGPEDISFPGLAITLIDNINFHGTWDVKHTFVSKNALLTALGLSTEELEVKLGMISESVPDVVESREV